MHKINTLRIPLYKLYYIDQITDIDLFNDQFISLFRKEYSLSERKNILDSLSWAKDNPEYNFKNLLPNIKFENAEILKYLQDLHEAMKKNNLATE